MMPMPQRRLTSVAVRTGGEIYLFDCGEGTQVPYKTLHLGLRPLRLIAVSHLHADHCLGLPGLLMLRAQMPDPEPLSVVGPPGLERFIRHLRQDLAMYINYEIRITEWAASATTLAYEDEKIRLAWEPVAHSVFCLGYRLEEHPRPGRFDTAAAEALGIPFGPLRGRLQRGEAVVLPSGEAVRPEQVLGPTRPGRRIAFITDTTLTPALERLLHQVDLAFLEGMFLPEHLDEALAKKHLTVDQATDAATRAGAGRVILLHLSPRYEVKEEGRFDAVAAEHHPRARVGREGEVIELPLPEQGAQ
jgi:ribonuclease Z